MSWSRDAAATRVATLNEERVTRDAYEYCLAMARRHYENFPVASRLLPQRLRRPVSVIYAFARTADDIADEGTHPAEWRLAQLGHIERGLEAIQNGGKMEDLLFVALRDVVRHHGISLAYCHDLLTAFRLDVTNKRYATFDDVLHYCRHSANPVGRLILQLSDQHTAVNVADADRICTALQLINFLQDIAQDFDENNRIYLPQDEMAQFGVTEAQIACRQNSAAMKQLLDHQIHRAAALMRSGAALGGRLPGRLGWEIRLTVLGGLRVLDKLAAAPDVFARPRLGKRDWLRIALDLMRRRDLASGA